MWRWVANAETCEEATKTKRVNPNHTEWRFLCDNTRGYQLWEAFFVILIIETSVVAVAQPKPEWDTGSWMKWKGEIGVCSHHRLQKSNQMNAGKEDNMYSEWAIQQVEESDDWWFTSRSTHGPVKYFFFFFYWSVDVNLPLANVYVCIYICMSSQKTVADDGFVRAIVHTDVKREHSSIFASGRLFPFSKLKPINLLLSHIN